jgi:hypothetical protein
VHHFEGDALSRLFRGIARITDCFIACEPRRARVALLGSHLVGAIGANDVTRRDAVLSVRAGFSDRELSACWPDDGGWQLREAARGSFRTRLQRCGERRHEDQLRRHHCRCGAGRQHGCNSACLGGMVGSVD